MTRLAICGLGNIGLVHLANLRSLRGCEVAGVFDVRRPPPDIGTKIYDSFENLLADDTTHAVVIATPTASHRELTQAALARGKHVFVEKPLAGTLEDARAIGEAGRRTDLCVQVGFCERFNPQYIEAKRAIANDAIGEVRAIFSSRVAPYGLADPAWELGVLDTAVHNLDLILWIMGQAPDSVRSEGVQIYADSAIPHTVATFLRFPDGAIAVDHITWLRDERHPLSQGARSRMSILGARGSFEIDLTTRPSVLLTDREYRMRDTVILGAPEYYGCLKLQFESFLRSVEDGAPVMAPVDDAFLAERVVMAARESLASGTEVPLA